jgi:predicted O-methyltransferase YrrM
VKSLDLVQALVKAAIVEGPSVVDRLKVRAEGRRPESRASGALATSVDWSGELHALLDAPWPCELCAGFIEDVWAPVRARAGAAPQGRDLHDGDAILAHAAWSVTRHLAPAVVVETGVARGMTSAAILSAMGADGAGRLYSIDLPPLTGGWAEQSGAAVADELRLRWTYVRGSSRRRLPRLLAELGHIDVFVHDSLHTAETMDFEFRCAWEALRAGGVLLSDDIDDSVAFERFVAEHDGMQAVIGQESSKAGNRFGVIRKRRP